MIADDNGNPLDNNKTGEIYTRFPIHFLGYFNEPEKTRETFDGEWFKTGDLGHFDNEGFLYVVDRKKDLLKYQNFQITPSEIEEIINEMEGVASSCVFGIPEMDSGNDIMHAFVIADESRGLTEEQVKAHVDSRVIDAKRLRGSVRFVKSFPLGMSGKVDRRKMRELVAAK